MEPLTERSYPVPALVHRLAQDNKHLLALVADGSADYDTLYHLSDCQWPVGRVWAQSVIDGDPPDDRAMQVALVATGYSPGDGHGYFGLLDPEYEDHDVVMAALRQSDQGLSRWDGTRWEDTEENPTGLQYVELDADNLAYVVDALSRGSSGVVLRPTEPRAWLSQQSVPADVTNLLVDSVVAAADAPARTYAVVDEFDTSAVLHLIQVTPGPKVSERKDGAWKPAPDVLAALQSVDPPPVVPVGDDVLEGVVAQIDDFDSSQPKKDEAPGIEAVQAGAVPTNLRTEAREKAASAGHALPDGSFPIRNATELRKAISALGRAKDIGRAKAHIRKRAKALGLESSLPDSWRGVTAAGPWEESKYKRAAGGKFGAKDATAKAKQPKRAELPRLNGPRPDLRGQGPHPRDHTPADASTIRDEPWKMLDHSGRLTSGVGDAFWKSAPAGFHHWLTGFLQGMQPSGSSGGSSGKAAKPGHAVPGSKEARQAGAKAANAKAGREAGTKAGQGNWKEWKKKHPNAPDYTQQIPPKYRDAYMQWMHAAQNQAQPGMGGAKAGVQNGDSAPNPQAAADARRAKLQARDLGFDYRAAKKRVAENTRRSAYDADIAKHYDRLKDLPDGERKKHVDELRAKASVERRRRNEWDQAAKIEADNESVRRLGARRRETSKTAGELAKSVTADASLMPHKLKSYWATGKGALKIRWGVGGDFNRCRRQLARYLRPDQVSGACANLHKLATGHWPGPGKGT